MVSVATVARKSDCSRVVQRERGAVPPPVPSEIASDWSVSDVGSLSSSRYFLANPSMSEEKGSWNAVEVDDRFSIAEHRLVSRASWGRGLSCETAIVGRRDTSR